METAQLNVRIDQSLKAAGDKTLKELGWSSAKAVRLFWEYLASHVDKPGVVEDVFENGAGAAGKDARQAERSRRLAIADKGASLFSSACEALNIDPPSLSRDACAMDDDALREEALADYLEGKEQA